MYFITLFIDSISFPLPVFNKQYEVIRIVPIAKVHHKHKDRRVYALAESVNTIKYCYLTFVFSFISRSKYLGKLALHSILESQHKQLLLLLTYGINHTWWTYIFVNKVLNVKEQLCFVIDYHSKYVEIKKLPNMTAETVNNFVWCR